MNNLEELEKKYEELGKEIERLKKEKTNTRWRAKSKEDYYFIDNNGEIDSYYEKNDYIDNYFYEIGNYFKTEEQAEKQLKKLKIYMQLKDLALRLNNGEKIDWDNINQRKFSIVYDYDINQFKYLMCYHTKNLGQIYCLDEDFKDKALEEIGEENLKLLYEVESEE